MIELAWTKSKHLHAGICLCTRARHVSPTSRSLSCYIAVQASMPQLWSSNHPRRRIQVPKHKYDSRQSSSICLIVGYFGRLLDWMLFASKVEVWTELACLGVPGLLHVLLLLDARNDLSAAWLPFDVDWPSALTRDVWWLWSCYVDALWDYATLTCSVCTLQ